MALALEGVKIVDLTRYAPGPYCTMILADLGAEVIKIEEGIVGQGVPEFPPPGSPYDPLNRNKQSIVINLKTDAGKEIFYRLAEKADVVVEGFRPGVAGRLGIDYEALKKLNDRLIYCSISGYGQSGPYRDLPGHDINYIAQAGAMGLMLYPAIARQSDRRHGWRGHAGGHRHPGSPHGEDKNRKGTVRRYCHSRWGNVSCLLVPGRVSSNE